MDTERLPQCWWEHSAGVMEFGLKPWGLTLRDVLARLDQVQEWGFDAIWLGPLYHGGIQYTGLDIIDLYAVDPALGTMADLDTLITSCHERGMAIVASFNLGYASMEFPPFLKACDDVRAGVDSSEARWFLWSETGTEELDRSGFPFFRQDLHGYWHHSGRAGKYYWVKWAGEDGEVDMPQFNFGDPAWQEECRRAVTFWMETGLDGMVVDAMNWYLNCSWEINSATITGPLRSYGNKFVQPEGAGGFKDDPVPWITQGHYNCVHDYEVAIPWAGRSVILNALQTGRPQPIEWALRAYRDRVVAAGGITWLYPTWCHDLEHGMTPEQMLLEAATVATTGELFVGHEQMFRLRWAPEMIDSLKALLKARRDYPALGQIGKREKLRTHNDRLFYAFVRRSPGVDQDMLVVLNFQGNHRQIRVEMERPATLTDIATGQQVVAETRLELALPPYGYRVYVME